MKDPTLSNFQSAMKRKRTHAVKMYQRRPIKYWHDQLRRFEVVLDALSDYRHKFRNKP